MKPQKQSSATRKPPAMSVEEELAELLADPTLRPSITFLGLRSDTETVPDTKSVSDTDSVHPIILYRQNPKKIELVPDTETVSGTSSISDTVSVPVKSSVFGVPKLGFGPPKPDPSPARPRSSPGRKPKVKGLPRYERPKPMAARQIQDGHSHSEQAMYATLWDAAEPFSHEARIFTIGFGAMSRIVRLSLNNCRLNMRSLIRKLAVEELRAAECEKKIGKTYLIYNANSIMRRRKTAGFEWVIRTRGVVFVDPKTGSPLLPEGDDPVSDTKSVSDTQSVSGTNSVSDTGLIPVTGTDSVGVLVK